MKPKKKMIPICIAIPEDFSKKMDELAEKVGTSRSAFYRTGLIQYYDFQMELYGETLSTK